MRIQIAEKVNFAFRKKRELGVKILILVGGRGSTKSTGAADYVLAHVDGGQRWCCAREYLNSIDDSCQALLEEEIERCGFEGFTVHSRGMDHESGGCIFHKGLSRNPDAIKSMVADGIWIEEGERLSERTIKVLSASFRISAGKQEKARREGKEAKVPDVIITMNRGSANDPVSKEYLKAGENALATKGWYADEDVLIVQVNYTDIPRDWFMASGLEPERARDERLMSAAEYRHKWGGDYNDTIENAIIQPDWFDACIDAHKTLAHLGDFMLGQDRVAFDPSDVGPDPEALAHRKGNVIVQAMQSDVKDIEAACTWSCSYANEKRVDEYIWDCDGMGVGLKYQVSAAFKESKIVATQFKGSEGPENPKAIFEEVDKEQEKPKTNEQTFINQRAQYYMMLAMAMFRTWLAVRKGRVFPIEKLISFSSEIKHLDILRAELCSVPRKFVPSGRIQLLTKAEMLKQGIASPNVSDCVMMLQKPVASHSEWWSTEISYPESSLL